MSRWLINARGQQFSAGNLEELKQFAKKGALGAGDIVQPPGASDWLYAVEVPELKKVLRTDVVEDASPSGSAGPSTAVKGVAAVVMLIGAVGLGSYAYDTQSNMVSAEDLDIIGKEDGFSYSQVLVTDAGKLRSDASASASEVGAVEKNARCGLLSKRGTWYKLRCGDKEGYLQIDQVIPAYYFGSNEDRQIYDPLYNPDRYVTIANLAWRLPLDSKVTTMSLMVQNSSKYTMTGLKLQATIKDKHSSATQELEIAVEGPIPAKDGTMIGTILPAKGDKEGKPRIVTVKQYEEELKSDAKLSERWKEGVEIPLTVQDPDPAPLNIVEIQAVAQ